MIYDRSEFDEVFLHNGVWYESAHAYIRIKGNEVDGSDNRMSWSRLKGVEAMSFGNNPPGIAIEEEVDFDPIDYARQ